MSSNKIKLSNQNGDLRFREMVWVWIPPIWRAVLSLFYPPVIIRGKNGKNSENPVGSNKSEKRKPKSAVYRSFWASVVYFHLRLISTKSHKREMTRNAVDRKVSRVRIPNSPPKTQSYQGFRPYDWAFLFSQGHIGVHDFRQELRYASRSALCPADSGYCPLHLPRWSWTCNPSGRRCSPWW